MTNRLPDFIIIGAARAGTSSLYAYLNEHPQVFMSPIKETNYFAYEGRYTKNFLEKRAKTNFPVKTLKQYQALFKNAHEHNILGEASPLYLESPVAAARIKQKLPAVKIIASLRNPADRAFSGYVMAVRNGNQKPDNMTKLLSPSSHYVQAGLYYDKLIRYYELFPKSQIKICLLDDLHREGLSVVHSFFDFLGADNSFLPDVNVKYNVSYGFPRSYMLSRILRVLRNISRTKPIRKLLPSSVMTIGNLVFRKNQGPNIVFTESIRRRLIQFYREDIIKLQDLIQRDLSTWLEAK